MFHGAQTTVVVIIVIMVIVITTAIVILAKEFTYIYFPSPPEWVVVANVIGGVPSITLVNKILAHERFIVFLT